MHPVTPSSPTCYLGDDGETRRDVMRWRKAERLRLLTWRQALPVALRAAAERQMLAGLEPETGAVIGRSWPFRGEPDLRAWAAARRSLGARVALPVVINKAQPLGVRLWQPGVRLARGVWDIPVPPESAEVVLPDLVISPVVGVDPEGFRLGYGGGFYDRTLAQMRASGHAVRVIGIGYQGQALPTIFPLSHDVAMDRVILG